MLRVQEFPVADAAGAEHCGYGDLRKAAGAVDVCGLDAACRELRGPPGHEGINSEPWLTGLALLLQTIAGGWMAVVNCAKSIRSVG